MEHELIPVYTKFTGNGVRVQNDSKLIVVLYVIEKTTANHWSKRNE